MKIQLRGSNMLAIHSDDLIRMLAGTGVKHNIERASNVEPRADGKWTADMAPVNGPVLDNNGDGYEYRGQALKAETDWLNSNMNQVWSART